VATTSEPTVEEQLGRLRVLRSHPEVCRRVVPGSVALPLVPALRGGEWSLTSLLALPRGCRTGRAYEPAWGALEWRWPAGRPLQLVRLSRLPDVPPPDPDPAHWRCSGQDDERRAFDAGLAVLLAGGGDAGLAALAPLLRPVLPSAADALLWALLPETRAWLR
jgi:hypothetical protein